MRVEILAKMYAENMWNCMLECMLKCMLPTRNAGSQTALSAPLAPLRYMLKCTLKYMLKCMLNASYDSGRTLYFYLFSHL